MVKWYCASLLGVLLVALFAIAAAGCARQSPPPALVGTVMTKKIAAIDFSLDDQRGEPFRLSLARGKVVVLSFIFTHCDDTCPFMTLKIKETRDLLGPLSAKVVFVAVTTDPERDTPEVIAAYSREAGLYDDWHFLTGSLEAVRKVWTDYGVGVRKVEAEGEGAGGMGMGAMADGASKGLSAASLALAKGIAEKFGGGYGVNHTAPFWFIDSTGDLRTVLNSDALPQEIVTNIKALLGQS
jgi:cytochrome oxidase Cu insertion factor (SCO1/SenC/PrrC family)